MKYKVAFIIDVWDDPSSGAVVTAHRFVKELQEFFDIHIVTTKTDNENKNLKIEQVGMGNSSIKKYIINGYYFPGFKSMMKDNGMKFGKTNHLTRKVLKEVIGSCDIVYVHFPFRLEWAAINIAKKLNKPVVAGFHVQPENIFSNVRVKYFRYILEMVTYKIFVNQVYKKVDMIIAPSIMAKNLLINNGVLNNIEVISNGLKDRFKPDYSKKVNSDDFKILSVGRFSHEKKQKLIINAISRSKYKDRIILKMNGKGPLESSLYKYANNRNINMDIGFVSDKELLNDYQSYDLFIHASEVELEGMSVLEAIGCGCPALISDSSTSASSQFALDDRFKFKSGNVRSLVNKIDYWYENRSDLMDISKSYVKLAEKYRFNTSVENMKNLLMIVMSVVYEY